MKPLKIFTLFICVLGTAAPTRANTAQEYRKQKINDLSQSIKQKHQEIASMQLDIEALKAADHVETECKGVFPEELFYVWFAERNPEFLVSFLKQEYPKCTNAVYAAIAVQKKMRDSNFKPRS